MAVASTSRRQPLAQHANVRGVAQDRESFSTTGFVGSTSVFRGADHRSQFALGREAGRHCTVNLTGEIASSVGPTHYFAGMERGPLAVRGEAFATSHFVSTKSR